MERYTNTILNKQGKPVAGAVVTVTTYPGNEPATIYATDGGQVVKSVTTDLNGRFYFYAADGHYNLSISGKHIDPFTITDIVLNDPSDDLSLGALQPVKDDLDALQLPDYAALRAYKGPRKSVYVTGAGIAGMFVRDDADTTSSDNGGTVIVANGKRWKRKFAGPIYAEWFGVIGGAPDETANLRAATNAAAGAVVVIQAGKTVKVVDTIAVPKDTCIVLRGVTIDASASHFTLFNFTDGGGIIGGKLVGAGGAAYNAGGVAVNCAGASDGVNAPSYVKHPTLSDVWITGWGAYGVQAKYAQDGSIDGGCLIENCGYAGYGGYSVSNVHIRPGARIRNIIPGTGGNAYGAFFSRAGTSSLVTDPRPVDCSVVGAIIDNVPLWEGLDTHGGDRIHFAGCTVTRCKIGIAIGPSNGGVASMFAPHRCTATGNDIDGGITGAGITLTGARASGAVVEYAEDNVIALNKIRGHGVANNDIQGAIVMHTTRRTSINGGSIRNPAMFGVCVYVDNLDFHIGGLTIIDPFDNAKVNPSCIGVRDKNNTGVIAPNTFIKADTSLATYVAVFAMYVTPAISGNDITIEKQHFSGFAGNTLSIPADQTKINYSGIGTASGSASITINSGDGTASAVVTFGKALPMPIKGVSLAITSSLTVGGKAPLLTIGNKTNSGFTIYARPYDLTTFTAAGTLTVDWSAST